MLYDEFFQFNRKRQILQQHAAALVEDGGGGACAFGHKHIAAKSGVAGRQAMLRGHFGNHSATCKDRLATEPLLHADEQITIEQAADADQDDGAVSGDVAQLIGAAGFGSDHRAVLTLLDFDFPATAYELAGHAVCGHRQFFGQYSFMLVPKGLQTFLADAFFVNIPIGQNFWRIACDAQRGGDHQKRQDQHEPPSAVDRGQAERHEHIAPKWAELVHIVIERFALLEHRANHRGNADHGQQRN